MPAETVLPAAVLALLNNWATAPGLAVCFHCGLPALGAAEGVPCHECRGDVQHEADVQAWRAEEAEAEYWRTLPMGGRD